MDLCALEPSSDNVFRRATTDGSTEGFRLCANQVAHKVCNWIIPEADEEALCKSCRLNEMIPDLSVAGNLERWHKLELAKRRLVYGLIRLGLPLEAQGTDPAKRRLRFRFLAQAPNGPGILTGHRAGVITMNIAEADDAVREQQRVNLHEPYRTLLGHFRHEIAHYYWEQLIANGPRLLPFREHFGDESNDYNASLKRHYVQGAPPDWQRRHVSSYASAHPWEDWAETWAHYLHIQDTVETAASFGLRLQPRHPDSASMTADPRAVEKDDRSFDRILRAWLPVTYAVNELNRGMGLPDVYPFVLSDVTVEKLRFIHQVVREAGQLGD
jgi:hypothetical protein